jgi:hypothetical protein
MHTREKCVEYSGDSSDNPANAQIVATKITGASHSSKPTETVTGEDLISPLKSVEQTNKRQHKRQTTLTL